MASRAAPAVNTAAPARARTHLVDEATLHADNPIILAFAVMMASLLVVLDSTIANVALPKMQATLGATPDTITWVLTSYIVASAVALPLTGWLADRIGSRRLFIFSVAGFVLASMLCGMAQNIEQMVIFRTVQGIAGAFITPLSQAVMIDTNRPSRQPQMMALWGMGIMIGPILGPILGGWLTENFNWRWVFYVNVPLGAVALVLMLAELPSRAITKRQFDLIGFALVAVMLSALQLMLDRGHQVDWFDSNEIWIYAGLIASALWVAGIHFMTVREPLFRRELLADSNFVISLAFMVIVGASMFATMALLPPLLQGLLGYPVITTGIALMPRGVGTLLSMQVAGVLVRKGCDGRWLVAAGFALSAISLWQMATWSLQIDEWHIWISGLIQGFGLGLVFIPLNSGAFATLAPELRTDGSSLLNLLRSIGASIGISVVTAFMARNQQVAHADLGAHITSSTTQIIDVAAADRFQVVGDTMMRVIDGLVNQQAAMIAFIDNFYLMMWVNLAAIPIVLLMKKSTLPVQGPPPAH